MASIMAFLPGSLAQVTATTQTIAGTKTFANRAYIAQDDSATEFGTAGYGYLRGSSSAVEVANGVSVESGIRTAQQANLAQISILATGTQLFISSGQTPGTTWTPTQTMRWDATGWRRGTTGAATRSRLDLPAGTATAGTAPMKFTEGVLLAAPEALALEEDAGALFWTPAATRERIFTGLALVSNTLNPASIASKAVADQAAVAVTGAATGDPALVGVRAAMNAGIFWCAYVSSAGNLKMRLANISAGAIDPASGTDKYTEMH